MARNYFAPVTERQRIDFYYYYRYPKGVLLAVCLPFIILLFTGITAVLLYNVIYLKTELENLRDELKSSRKPEIPLPTTLLIDNNNKGASGDTSSSWTGKKETGKPFNVHEEDATTFLFKSRKRRHASEEKSYASFLQLIPDRTRKVENEGDTSIIPWVLGVKHGTALEVKENKILIKENGLFFIYSQVWYKDKTFAMGHEIQRKKMETVGNDPNLVTLYRCIQNMPESNPNNTCFTGGLAKLEEGDEVLLKIGRSDAEISLSGDATFFGVIKLV